MDNPNSKIELVKLGARESVTALATVDDLIVHAASEGGLVIEFVVHDARDKPLKSYRLRVCPEDAERIRKAG